MATKRAASTERWQFDEGVRRDIWSKLVRLKVALEKDDQELTVRKTKVRSSTRRTARKK